MLRVWQSRQEARLPGEQRQEVLTLTGGSGGCSGSEGEDTMDDSSLEAEDGWAPPRRPSPGSVMAGVEDRALSPDRLVDQVMAHNYIEATATKCRHSTAWLSHLVGCYSQVGW